MIATTISSSMRVNPSFFSIFFTGVSLRALGPEGPKAVLYSPLPIRRLSVWST
jgi:hypothetical protein